MSNPLIFLFLYNLIESANFLSHIGCKRKGDSAVYSCFRRSRSLLRPLKGCILLWYGSLCHIPDEVIIAHDEKLQGENLVGSLYRQSQSCIKWLSDAFHDNLRLFHESFLHERGNGHLLQNTAILVLHGTS